ncbi:hypothetical protein B0O80DRAFT_465024 [Mortierella sp. GBAus27b]|nr:hypothetical protein B0O80DRAFT_465024 [Mortierella sp. GBAus27b]
MKTTTEILKKLPRLEHLETEYGGISVISSVQDGQIQDVDLTIERVGDLSSKELDFMKPHHLTRLAIKFAPQGANTDQFGSILRHWTKLDHLQIGCDALRALAVINTVIGAKERAVISKTPSCLRTFELMDEKLVSFDEYGECDDSTHIQTHISFDDGSTSFDMRSWVRLGNRMCTTDNNPVYEFVRCYGWSIVFLEENWTYNDTFAAILEDIRIPEDRVFQLETLCFETSKFTDSGLRQLESIIQRSPNFQQLGLRFELAFVGQFDTIQSLLKRHGSQLFKLQLHGSSSVQWLQKFMLLFPSRASFPNLKSFEFSLESDGVISWPCLRWIATMISTPDQALTTSMSSLSLSQNADRQNTIYSSGSTVSRNGLRKILLSHIELSAGGWERILEALDFAELRHLDLRLKNLTRDMLDQLTTRMDACMALKAQLETLNIEDSGNKSGISLNWNHHSNHPRERRLRIEPLRIPKTNPNDSRSARTGTDDTLTAADNVNDQTPVVSSVQMTDGESEAALTELSDPTDSLNTTGPSEPSESSDLTDLTNHSGDQLQEPMQQMGQHNGMPQQAQLFQVRWYGVGSGVPPQLQADPIKQSMDKYTQQLPAMMSHCVNLNEKLLRI